jgi:hypothetical protein
VKQILCLDATDSGKVPAERGNVEHFALLANCSRESHGSASNVPLIETDNAVEYGSLLLLLLILRHLLLSFLLYIVQHLKRMKRVKCNLSACFL